jgi:hypothetical protein
MLLQQLSAPGACPANQFGRILFCGIKVQDNAVDAQPFRHQVCLLISLSSKD